MYFFVRILMSPTSLLSAVDRTLNHCRVVMNFSRSWTLCHEVQICNSLPFPHFRMQESQLCSSILFWFTYLYRHSDLRFRFLSSLPCLGNLVLDSCPFRGLFPSEAINELASSLTLRILCAGHHSNSCF